MQFSYLPATRRRRTSRSARCGLMLIPEIGVQGQTITKIAFLVLRKPMPAEPLVDLHRVTVRWHGAIR